MFEQLATLVQPWADLYSGHSALSTGIIALHIVSMFVGGGIALATDRSILRIPAGRTDQARAAVADLAATHLVVIMSLAFAFLSGLALFLADVENFAGSAVYWCKMGAVGLLLANGMRMRRAESHLLHDAGIVAAASAEASVFPVAAWGTLRATARVSLSLWLLIVVLGVVLTNG